MHIALLAVLLDTQCKELEMLKSYFASSFSEMIILLKNNGCIINVQKFYSLSGRRDVKAPWN
jgi:hypothetical protein